MKYSKTSLIRFNIEFPSAEAFSEFAGLLKQWKIKPALIHGGEHKRDGKRTFSASFINDDADFIQGYLDCNGKEVKQINL